MDCETVRASAFAYIDGELDAVATLQLEAHLSRCVECRRLVDLELACQEPYVDRLRPSPVPPQVRRRTEKFLDDLVRRRRAGRSARRPRLALCWIAAVLVLGIGIWTGTRILITRLLEPGRALQALAEAAVEQHRKLVSGALAVDVREVAPGRTQAWLAKRVTFNVELPAPPTGDRQLLGGRLARLLDTEVAEVEYSVDGAPVSLFVLPKQALRPLRLSGRREFKTVVYQGYDVIVWRSRGVGYALVSEIGERACLVCHVPDELLHRR
jgi:anti-sigma factor RsiW